MKAFKIILLPLLLISACSSISEQQETLTVDLTITPEPTTTFTPSPTFTPTITRTPGPTPIPCPNEETPFTIDGINVFFEQGMMQSYCNRFGGYIVKTNQWAKSIGESIHADVFVYNSAESAAQADYTWGRKTGCNNYTSNSLPEILEGWRRGGALAYPPYKEGYSPYTDYPARVILNAAWRESSQQVASSTVHELTHTIQYQYYGGRNPCSGSVPSWWIEGEAMYYGYGVIVGWGMPYFELDLSECAATQLSELPQLTNNCVYGMGREALYLLSNLYGERSFEVWKEIDKGASFESAFETIYGISVREFSDVFEKYKMCSINQGFGVKGYLTCLPSPASTPTP